MAPPFPSYCMSSLDLLSLSEEEEEGRGRRGTEQNWRRKERRVRGKRRIAGLVCPIVYMALSGRVRVKGIDGIHARIGPDPPSLIILTTLSETGAGVLYSFINQHSLL